MWFRRNYMTSAASTWPDGRPPSLWLRRSCCCCRSRGRRRLSEPPAIRQPPDIQTSEGALADLSASWAIEAHYQPKGVKQLPSYSIAAAPPPLTTAMTESAGQLVFASTELEARIDKSPLRIR